MDFCVRGIECAISEKNPYPPNGRSLEIPRGWGILKVKILEAKAEAKLEFPRRSGVQKKKPSVGGGGGGYEFFLFILLSGEV